MSLFFCKGRFFSVFCQRNACNFWQRRQKRLSLQQFGDFGCTPVKWGKEIFSFSTKNGVLCAMCLMMLRARPYMCSPPARSRRWYAAGGVAAATPPVTQMLDFQSRLPRLWNNIEKSLCVLIYIRGLHPCLCPVALKGLTAHCDSFIIHNSELFRRQPLCKLMLLIV